MAILYQTAKFKSANIFPVVIWDPTTKLILANISCYTAILCQWMFVYNYNYYTDKAISIIGSGVTVAVLILNFIIYIIILLCIKHSHVKVR